MHCAHQTDSGVCGKVLSPLPTDEEKTPAPQSIYAITKRAQEELFLAFGRAYGMPVTVLRYFNTKAEGEAAVREKAEGTILLVEDEQLLRDFMQSHLEARGFHVIPAVDGLQAVDLFYKHKDDISLVFSDMGLPNLGGWGSVQEDERVQRFGFVPYLRPGISIPICVRRY